MIEFARTFAKKSGSENRFILGDIRSKRIDGSYDTIILLGNALIHFNTMDFVATVRSIKTKLRHDTYFLIDYRDVVEMLFKGKWSKICEDKLGRRNTVSLSKGIDTQRGEILVRSETNGNHNLDFSHAIWSPFIIEPLMAAYGWKPVNRYQKSDWNGWLDVYKT